MFGLGRRENSEERALALRKSINSLRARMLVYYALRNPANSGLDDLHAECLDDDTMRTLLQALVSAFYALLMAHRVDETLDDEARDALATELWKVAQQTLIDHVLDHLDDAEEEHMREPE